MYDWNAGRTIGKRTIRKPEIREYLRRCADDFGIRPFVRLRHDIESAEWREDERRWHVATRWARHRSQPVWNAPWRLESVGGQLLMGGAA